MLRFSAWVKFLALLAVVLSAAGYAIYHSDWFQRQYVYPLSHREQVFRYAKDNNLDPFLVAAVIRTESRFVVSARSPKGAVGLMQMMPETGRWVAGQIDYPDFSATMLTDPDINIRFGTWYLASLKREFQNNDILALAAYNGGRGNVRQWINQFGWPVDFRDFSQIPFQETRDYVRKVLDAREHYRYLYGRL
ncbi:MAG: lytic transglycosylase domain-containing protein [Negativicutes bacterium]|nr:lytic transglycosylase domain-containing protein [Negativicutes bacterium]